MAVPHYSWNMIRFAVPRSAAAQIRRWQQDVNLRLIAGHLIAKGEAMVTRLGTEDDLITITYLPGLGEAEPYVGAFGGLYTFIFSPDSDGCALQVVAASPAFTWAAIDPVAPLDLYLPGRVVPTKGEEKQDGWDWSSPNLTADGDNFVHEVSRDELEFFIDGEMYERLVAWGWECLEVEAYSYRFIPLSVGCEIAVKHLPTGREVHLTEGVGW